jgi:hypothetical protein
MKFAADRPYADPEKAARKLIEIANAAEHDPGFQCRPASSSSSGMRLPRQLKLRLI